MSPTFFVNTAVGYFGTDSFQVTDTVFSSELRHLFGAFKYLHGRGGIELMSVPGNPVLVAAAQYVPRTFRPARVTCVTSTGGSTSM